MISTDHHENEIIHKGRRRTRTISLRLTLTERLLFDRVQSLFGYISVSELVRDAVTEKAVRANPKLLVSTAVGVQLPFRKTNGGDLNGN